MKILSERQQLLKRKDELWKAAEFLNFEISNLQEKINKTEDSWFSNKGTVRVNKYMKKEYEAVKQFIMDYYSVISQQLDSLNPTQIDEENKT